MKLLLTYIFFPLGITLAHSQTDTVPNSFAAAYKTRNPSLKYEYDSRNQTHNYSGNWDFDKDGITDKLFFVGTGGAHLYFYLRIILSSDNIVRNYPSIVSDMPILPSEQKLNTAGLDPLNPFMPFAVYDFDGDGVKDIFLYLDIQTVSASSKQLKKYGITSNAVLVTFKNKKPVFSNYRTSIKVK